MIRLISNNIFRFLLLSLIQVMVLNNIELNGYINPFLYVLFILMLPFNTPAWSVLVLGFLMGLVIDLFSDTHGMHTTATVFISYFRIYWLKFLSPRDGYDNNNSPSYKIMGMSWFLTYAGGMVLLHHLILFFAESFKFSEFFFTLGKILFSTIITLLLIIIAQALVQIPNKRE